MIMTVHQHRNWMVEIMASEDNTSYHREQYYILQEEELNHQAQYGISIGVVMGIAMMLAMSIIEYVIM